jgi:hypothetical protein
MILALLVIIQLSSILAFEYWKRVEEPAGPTRYALHTAIIDGDAPYQFRYRVLIPAAAEVLAQLLQRVAFQEQQTFSGVVAAPEVTSVNSVVRSSRYSKRSFYVAYILLNWTAITAFLLFLYLLICEWWEPSYGLFGIVLAAVVVGLTFRDHYFHPWSFWEAALLAAGLWMVRREHYRALAHLVVAGAFVRETTVFLPLGFLFYALPRTFSWAELKGRTILFALGNILLWLAAYAVVHVIIGYKPATFTIDMAVRGNLTHLHYAIALNALVLGPAWLLAIRGLLSCPELFQRFALAFLPYLGVLGVIGYWWEIRYWMTPLPILIPAVISALRQHHNIHQPVPEVIRKV